MNQQLEWHKFTKKTMPLDDCEILVCREFGNSHFFTTVNVFNGTLTMCNYYGLVGFEPDRRDRWTYIPMPEK